MKIHDLHIYDLRRIYQNDLFLSKRRFNLSAFVTTVDVLIDEIQLIYPLNLIVIQVKQILRNLKF